jgi:hypothetical protein
MKAPKEFFEFVFARPEWFQREMITAAEVDAIYTAAVEASGLETLLRQAHADIETERRLRVAAQERVTELQSALDIANTAMYLLAHKNAKGNTTSAGEPLILTGGEDDAI